MSSGTTIGTAYVQIVPSAKGLSRSITKALGGEVESAGKSAGTKLSGSIGGALKVGLGVATAAVGAATAAVGKFASSAVSSYANYEQLVGGVKKLYGTAGQSLEEYAQSVGKTTAEAAEEYHKLSEAEALVQKNAEQAYKTAGMSANQYMETATSFSASLINSLGGDTQKAAELTDVAMKAMSDNVNTFGSDVGSVTNAYQGFAKQNYTMLDNLKLGYGGTKSEMERLIEDANEYAESIGKASDLSIDSFADVVQAIQLIQEKQNIAGTTGREAMTTIEGAANATKAAWENVITAIGRGEGLDDAFNGLMSSIFGEQEGEGLLNQVIPRIQTTMEGIGTFVSQAAPMITEKLPELINSIVPSLLESAGTLVGAIGQGLMTAIPTLLPVITDVFMQIVEGFTNNISSFTEVANEIILTLIQGLIQAAPTLVEGATQLVTGLATGIGQMLPTLIPAAVEMILTIAQGLIDNADQIVQGAIELMTGLTEGITQATPILIEKIPELVTSLAQAIIDNAPALASALTQCLPQILQAIVQINLALVQAIIQGGIMLLEPIGQIIMQMITQIGASAGQFVAQVAATGAQVLAAMQQWLSQLPAKLVYWAGFAAGRFVATLMTLPQRLSAVWTSITTAVTSFATQFAQQAAEMAKAFFNNLVNGLQTLPAKLRSLGQQLVGAFKELPEKFAEIGGQIVEGLWNGISEGWKWLKESVANLANSLVEGVKAGLKIGSPSKVFADEVGKWIPAGIAAGIQGNLKVLDNAMNDMMAELTESPASGTFIMEPAYAAAGGDAAMAGGYSQTINIYSPQELSPSEVARQTRNATRGLVLAMRGK